MESIQQSHPISLPQSLSLIAGSTSPPLVYHTLGSLLDLQSSINPAHEAIICPTLSTRWTYSQLQSEALSIAKGLLFLGILPGDRIGILAGNCAEYVAVFFAAGYVGATLVVLNNTYTVSEAKGALFHSGCRLLFTVPRIGRQDIQELLHDLGPRPRENGNSQTLENVVMLRDSKQGYTTYSDLQTQGYSITDWELHRAGALVHPDDICNLQYTSGSTGSPKAAMLTHFNLINNALAIGSRLDFTPSDILCCPPPLFHCFGLVLGVLAILSHGATIVLPSETFSPAAVLQAIADESCTALHGVPTMFEEILNLLATDPPTTWDHSNLRLRTGIIAGAPVPRPLMKRLLAELGMNEFTSSYGLTEASPTCFNAFTHDSISTRLTTVGKLLPHLKAKIISRSGEIVPLGERGELCISGYSICKGYWQNEEKTNDAIRTDEEGVRWLHTGDEAAFCTGEREGYAVITGRFKDIIIRGKAPKCSPLYEGIENGSVELIVNIGGENIYPVEVESRIVAHPSGAITRAAVIGIPNSRLGEVVGTFLQLSSSVSTGEKPSDDEIRDWTRKVLGRHKAPAHIFWFGEEGIDADIPQTGSGKVKKHVLRDWGVRLVQQREERAGRRQAERDEGRARL